MYNKETTGSKRNGMQDTEPNQTFKEENFQVVLNPNAQSVNGRVRKQPPTTQTPPQKKKRNRRKRMEGAPYPPISVCNVKKEAASQPATSFLIEVPRRSTS